MAIARDNPEIFDESYRDPEIKPPEPFGLIIPLNVPRDIEAVNWAQQRKEWLAEQYTPQQIHVLVKSAIRSLEHLLEANIEDVIQKMQGKEELVLGAKLTLRRSAEYDYGEDQYITSRDQEIKAKREEIKAWKNLREKSVTVNPETGEEMPKAKLVKDGLTPSVTLPK